MAKFQINKLFTSSTPHNGSFFTVAIDGRGASGKSALAAYLVKLSPDFTVLNGDDYFEPIDHPDVWGDFNNERFTQDIIEPLKYGNSFICRPYDWHAEPRLSERPVSIVKGFCLERCYSFTFDLNWDLKIWVETPKEVCLERGLARETMLRDKALTAWRFWQAAEDQYIHDTDPVGTADIVINGTQLFEGQIG